LASRRIITTPPLRWWGWGDRETDIPPGLAVLLRDELGVEPGTRMPSVLLGSVILPRSAIAEDDALLIELRDLCGATVHISAMRSSIAEYSWKRWRRRRRGASWNAFTAPSPPHLRRRFAMT